ncbi:14115_t:CDS:2, partial [Entrophospora sp. SA101]
MDTNLQKIKSEVFLDLKNRETKVPIKGKRNILVTSALPYVNNVPHLGNIIGSVLSADIFARYSRARNYNILYICGTDEYGTATETKALEEGISCQELCDKYNVIHNDVYKWFEIDFDYFGRTTTHHQTEISQDIFLKLHKNDYLTKDTVIQLFCEGCKRFLADRFVEGTCPNPKCKYEDARGDQCDSCGQLLNAIDLVNPRCKTDGSRPITKESTHMFLDLAALQKDIESWVEKTSIEGNWTLNGKTITKSWLKEGLRQRCITRDLKWGTPVPLEEMKDKVFYVWFDAPIGYLSITANYTEEWEKWWKNPEEVKLYQFMGKDNVPFHTVIFPGSLLGTKDKWTLLHHINTTDTGIPVSVWRYYLIMIRPETSDSMFTWKEFISKNNTELLANLGNFVNRVIKFSNSKYTGVIPSYTVDSEAEQEFIKNINLSLTSYVESLEAVKLRAGLEIAMDISRQGNGFLQDSKFDNTLFKEHPNKCASVIGLAVNLIYLLSALFYPYMPSTSESILRQLNAPTRIIPDTWTGTDIQPGHKLGKAEYLFKKIDEIKEQEFHLKY